MGVFGTEVGVPGVQVRVEVEEGDGAVPLGRSPQQRERDCVVAAESHQACPVGREVVGGGLDGFDRLADIERVHSDVAGVGDLRHLERGDVEGGMVGPEQA